MGEATFKRLQL